MLANRLKSTRMLAGLAVVVSALGPAAAQAQGEWTRLSTSPQGYVLHAQTPVRPTVGQTIQVNTLLDYEQTQYWGHKGERFQSSTAAWELNCNTGSYRAMGFAVHAERMGKGPSLTQQAQSTEWLVAPSGSIPSELLRWACR